MARRDMVPTSVALERPVAERLGTECGSVSAYLRALIDADTWRIDRAVAELRRRGFGWEEVGPLAAVEALDSPVVDAARVLVEARKMGREVPL